MTYLHFVDATVANNAQSWLGSVRFRLDADQCNMSTKMVSLDRPNTNEQSDKRSFDLHHGMNTTKEKPFILLPHFPCSVHTCKAVRTNPPYTNETAAGSNS
jgi:hypothetical protein